MPPASKSRVNDIQRRFGVIAAGANEYKGQGGVMVEEEFNAKVDEADITDDTTRPHGEDEKNERGGNTEVPRQSRDDDAERSITSARGAMDRD